MIDSEIPYTGSMEKGVLDSDDLPGSDARLNVVRSTQLLGRQRAITIEHEGSHYLLRATRNGKLILTK